MVAALGISETAAQRLWWHLRMKPSRPDRYMASNDPHLEQKAAGIIGLYMKPPQHAAVFCLGEKTAIQALDRLNPVLPLSPGRHIRREFVRFLEGLVERTSWAPETHVALDNLSAHKTKDVDRFVAEHPQVQFASRRPTRRGSMKWSCNSPKSSAT